MGRRSGFTGLVTAIARDIARAQRAAEADRRRRVREAEAAQRRAVRYNNQQRAAHEIALRDLKRTKLQEEKEARQTYIEDRLEEVESLNTDLGERITELKNILEHTLDINDTISFESLRIQKKFPPFKAPTELTIPYVKPEKSSFVSLVKRPSGLAALIPGAKKKYQRELKKAENEYQSALEHWTVDEQDRTSKLEVLGRDFEEKKTTFEHKRDQRNAEVDEFEKSYQSGESEAIVAYTNMVLERSDYPEKFPQEFRLSYSPESKQLVIEYELPKVDVVPSVLEYRYNKTRDEIAEKPRKQT